MKKYLFYFKKDKVFNRLEYFVYCEIQDKVISSSLASFSHSSKPIVLCNVLCLCELHVLRSSFSWSSWKYCYYPEDLKLARGRRIINAMVSIGELPGNTGLKAKFIWRCFLRTKDSTIEKLEFHWNSGVHLRQNSLVHKYIIPLGFMYTYKADWHYVLLFP